MHQLLRKKPHKRSILVLPHKSSPPQVSAHEKNAIKKATAMGRSICRPVDFQVGFLDVEGALIQTVSVQAETLTLATSWAGKIAAELEAANFVITVVPDFSRNGSAFPAAYIAKLIAPLSGFLARNIHPV
jgi:hypothetical protein